MLVHNAGIARILDSTLDPGVIDMAREIFETNFYGVIRVSQAFAPTLARTGGGGGAVVNVLSDASWFSRPFLSAYSASKSAAGSYTNAKRIELRGQGTLVQGLHINFMDTDMTAGFDMAKISPHVVARRALDGVAQGREEIAADVSPPWSNPASATRSRSTWIRRRSPDACSLHAFVYDYPEDV